jgi:hypothetical protein
MSRIISLLEPGQDCRRAGATLPSCAWPETPGCTERCGWEHCRGAAAR